MIVELIYSLTFLTCALLILFAISWKDVLHGLKFFLSKRKRGWGIIKIVGLDRKIATYLCAIGDFITVGKKRYCMDPTHIVYERGTPVVYYFVGDVKPIDMLKTGEESKIDPGYVDSLLVRDKSYSMQQGFMAEYNKIRILLYASIIAPFIVAFLVFQLQGTTNEMLVLLRNIAARP